jgi:hypothetical protein
MDRSISNSEQIPDVTYIIQKSPKVRSLVVHVDHLKPYYGATAILWKEIDFSPNEENLTIVNREFEDDINAVDSTEGNVNNLDASVKYSQNGFSDGEKEFNTDFKTPGSRRTRCGRAVRKLGKYSP